jgi:hypothetical protein
VDTLGEDETESKPELRGAVPNSVVLTAKDYTNHIHEDTGKRKMSLDDPKLAEFSDWFGTTEDRQTAFDAARKFTSTICIKQFAAGVNPLS